MFAIEKNNKNTILIVILMLVIIGLTAFIVYEKLNSKNSNNTTEENNNSENNNINGELKDVNKDELSYIISFWDNNEFSFKNGYTKTALFGKEKFIATDFSKKDLIIIGLNSLNVKNLCSDGGISSISIDEFNKAIAKVINTSDKVSILDLKSNSKGRFNDEYDYSYENENGFTYGISINNDTLNLTAGCGGNIGPQNRFVKKFISAKEDNNNLYLYVKAAFANYNENDLYSIYKPINMSEPIQKDIENVVIDWDKYDTYKITYKKLEGNLLLSTVELQK